MTALYGKIRGGGGKISITYDATEILEAVVIVRDRGIDKCAVVDGAQGIVTADTTAIVMTENERAALHLASCNGVVPHQAADAAVVDSFRVADGQVRHLTIRNGAFVAISQHAAHISHGAAVCATDGASRGGASYHFTLMAVAADAAPVAARTVMGYRGIVIPAPCDDAFVTICTHNALDAAGAAQLDIGEIKAVDAASVGEASSQITEEPHRVAGSGKV